MVTLLTTEVGPHYPNLLLVYQNQTWPCWTTVKGSILRPQQWHFCFHVLMVHSLSVHYQKFIVTDFLLVKMTLLSLDLVSCTQSCQGYQLIILPFLNLKTNSVGRARKMITKYLVGVTEWISGSAIVWRWIIALWLSLALQGGKIST